jgi:lipoprotein-anchoring transpeptidase ErfK/SrfK
MVLDSQAARRSSGGIGYSRGGRRRRRTKRTLGFLLLIGILGYMAWGYIAPSKIAHDDQASTANRDGSPKMPGDVKPITLTQPAAQAPKKEPIPDVISNVPGITETTKQIAAKMPDPVPVPPEAKSATPKAVSDPASKSAVINPPTDGTDPAPLIRSGGEAAQLIKQGRELIAQKQPVKAREVLSKALKGQINATDAEQVRQEVSKLNEKLVFSPAVEAGDPIAEAYVIQPGDTLVKVGKTTNVPWQFLKIVNNIADEKKIRLGARVKIIKGPFRVVVTKHEFRLDVWNGDLYIRSFPVGLGEFDSTPPGEWIVRGHSKLENPPWINPRTGERFEADDPKNPLGKRWVGLRGLDPETEKFSGYGIHGTIYPETIGQMASMGCVRLLPTDIALLYTMLEEEQSHVTILK